MFNFPFANAITTFGYNDKPLHAGIARARASLNTFAVGATARLNLMNRGAAAGLLGLGGGRGLANVGSRLGLGAAAMPFLGGAGALGATAGFVKLASDAEEMEARFRQVFREQGDEAEAFADKLARELGRSKHALMDMLTNFQLEFTASGLGREEARKMSETLQKLTVDLAAFHNMEEEDVGGRLFRALTGNHRALYELGVVMNQATLQEEMLRLGWSKQWNELTNLEKMYLRMNFVMRVTADAQGQAARESQNTAGRWRALTANLREMGIGIGRELNPAVRELLSLLVSATSQAKSFWGEFIDGAKEGDGFLSRFMGRLKGEFNAASKVRDLSAGEWLLKLGEYAGAIKDSVKDPLNAGEIFRKARERVAQLSAATEELMVDRFLRGGDKPAGNPAGLNVAQLQNQTRKKTEIGPQITGLIEFSRDLQMSLAKRDQEKLLNVNNQQLQQLKQLNQNVKNIKNIGHGEAMVAPD